MVSEVLVGTPVIASSEMRTESTGVQGKVTNITKVKRVTGARSMRVVFLHRLARYLDDQGFTDAVPEVLGWLEPKKHTTGDPQAIADLLARLEASQAQVPPREAAYLEAAIFCVSGWPPATSN